MSKVDKSTKEDSKDAQTKTIDGVILACLAWVASAFGTMYDNAVAFAALFTPLGGFEHRGVPSLYDTTIRPRMGHGAPKRASAYRLIAVSKLSRADYVQYGAALGDTIVADIAIGERFTDKSACLATVAKALAASNLHGFGVTESWRMILSGMDTGLSLDASIEQWANTDAPERFGRGKKADKGKVADSVKSQQEDTAKALADVSAQLDGRNAELVAARARINDLERDIDGFIRFINGLEGYAFTGKSGKVKVVNAVSNKVVLSLSSVKAEAVSK